ncbi:MAG: WhiB family transcriptional regulator [Streptomyces sp.]|jgi:hypothetical protein|nr:WhiB family transcriptional regulator [Streptomyces sp.]
MNTTTRRPLTGAAPARDWRTSAACQGIDTDTIFSDRSREQQQMHGICRGCPVKVTCLQEQIRCEGTDYTWGVAGGLTPLQRRALRVEALRGNRPNLGQARVLASPVFAEFMAQWRDWPADVVAGELRKHDVIASVVTVRVALWWTGAKGSVLSPRGPEDKRVLWEQVRDECQDLVAELRELRLSLESIAAYLGVSHCQVEQAVRSWNYAAKMAVAA